MIDKLFVTVRARSRNWGACCNNVGDLKILIDNGIKWLPPILVRIVHHQVYKDGLPVSRKPMEYDLFVLLLQNKNIALGREELLKRVWGENYLGESRTVDVHIGQLRKKLELYDEIRTIPKLGYRLEE